MESRKYETVVIFDHNTGEAQVKAEVKKVEGIFQANGAKGLVVDAWGRRELPQMMGGFAYGYFACYKYNGESSSVVSDIEGLLRITDGVKNFQTHRIRERSRKFKGNPRALKARESGEDDLGDMQEAEF